VELEQALGSKMLSSLSSVEVELELALDASELSSMTSASSSMSIVLERYRLSFTSGFRLLLLGEHALVLEVDVRATNCGSIKYRLKDKNNWNHG